MADYQKKIIYLDYLENGMKLSNAGFVRFEESNNQVRLEMRVKNIPDVFSGQYEWKADTGGTVGRISISRGNGGSCLVWQSKGKVADGKQWKTVNGIYVRLPGRHLLQALWPEPVQLLVEEEESEKEWKPEPVIQTSVQSAEKQIVEAVESAPELHEMENGSWKSEAQDEKADEQKSNIYSEHEVEAAWQEIAAEIEMEQKTEQDQELSEHKDNDNTATDKATLSLSHQDSAQEPICYGDKWEQLSHMYDSIHPFGDEREYLSIAPKDFVVMRREYQKMVHNSFLLHGYYNYRHLILGRLQEKNEWRYYLGVPGNFYTREKMVAEMFGFEAFEGEKTPAGGGDFGYFMKQVEI